MSAPDAISVAWVAATAAYGPLWVATDEGVFAKHGLAVSLHRLDPTTGVKALLAGEVDLYAGGTAALTAAIAGADLVYVAGIVDRFVLSLFAAPGIATVGELRGKVVGVTHPGAPTDAGARIALRDAGLAPDRDVTIAYLGSARGILAAFEQRAIDGGMLGPPVSALARQAGLRELVDLGKRAERFPQAAFIASRAYLAAHGDVVRRFFRGYGDGVRQARREPRRAQEIIGRYTGVSALDANVENYAAFAPLWELPPRVTAAGLRAALAVAPDPRARLVRPEDLIDSRIVDELNAAGAFEQGGSSP